jgi:hypothetical protein
VSALTNQSTSPTYISFKQHQYYFTITPYYTLPSSLVITGSTLKLGDLSTTAITATPYQFRPVRIFLSRL